MLRGKDADRSAGGVPGDICAIAKIDEIQFDHDPARLAPRTRTCTRSRSSCRLPVFGLAVTPKKRGDEQKVSDVLHKIAAEDPCFRIEHNAQANETVMRGLGEMHLRDDPRQDGGAVQDRARHAAAVDRRSARPSRRKAEGHSRHKKQTGGAGQFGEVFLKIEPLPRGKGFEFVDAVKGGTIPNQFIPSVEKGVRNVLEHGFVAGFPLQDVRVIVYDGKTIRSIRRTSRSCPPAARRSSTRSPRRGRSCSSRSSTSRSSRPKRRWATSRASCRHTAARSGAPTRRGRAWCRSPRRRRCPSSSSFPARLKSVTAGQGSYSLEFSHYEPAPPQLQQKLVAAHKPARRRGVSAAFRAPGARRPAAGIRAWLRVQPDDWRSQIEFFSKTHEVAACDLRGHG